SDDLTKQLIASSVVEGLSGACNAMMSMHPLEVAPKCYTNKPMEHHGIIPTGKVPNFKDGFWDKNKIAIFSECALALVTALHPPARYNTLSLEGVSDVEGLANETPSHFAKTLEQIAEEGWLAVE